MKNQYTKYEYKEAKDIIKDAELLSRAESPVLRQSLWKTPDGAIWSESESLLESPEDDYLLVLRMKEEVNA